MPTSTRRRSATERRLPTPVEPEPVIDLTDGPTVVDDPYLVALATGHSTLLDRGDLAPTAQADREWLGASREQIESLPALFQAMAHVEDDNAEVFRAARDSCDASLFDTLDLAVLFSERHRDLAIDRVDELVLLGAGPPDAPGPRTDPANQSLVGRARQTEHLWRAAERLLQGDRIEIVSATALRWWLKRSSSQWREIARRGLLLPEPGMLPAGVHRLYHLISETEHAGSVALYRAAELDDPELAKLADRRRSLSKLFRDRLAELDDRAPLPPPGDWSQQTPPPVAVGEDMNDELLDHPLDAALLDWYRREAADVIAQVRARGILVADRPFDPAALPAD